MTLWTTPVDTYKLRSFVHSLFIYQNDNSPVGCYLEVLYLSPGYIFMYDV